MGVVHQVRTHELGVGAVSSEGGETEAGPGEACGLDLAALDRAQVRAVTGGLPWTRYEAWRRFAAAFHAALGVGRDAPKLERVLAALGIVVHTAPAWLFLRSRGVDVVDVHGIIRVEAADGTTAVAISDGANEAERAWLVRMTIACRVLWLLGAEIGVGAFGPVETDDYHLGGEKFLLKLEVVGQTIAGLLLVPEAMFRAFVPEGSELLYRDAEEEERDAICDALERRSYAGASVCYSLACLTDPSGVEYVERDAMAFAKAWLWDDVDEAANVDLPLAAE